MFDVILDGVSLRQKGFLCQKRPEEPTAKRKVKTAEPLQSDGKIYRSLPFYEDKEQTLAFNFLVSKDYEFNDKIRQFRKLVRDAKELIFSDDPFYYRRIKAVTIGSCSRPAPTLGRMNVVFTLDPYSYAVSGKHFYDDPLDYKTNEHDQSWPVYHAQGSGSASLTVNGYTCTIDCSSGAVFLDTERSIAYGPAGQNRNSKTNADYKKLALKPGKNTISISNGALEVQPNWRDL